MSGRRRGGGQPSGRGSGGKNRRRNAPSKFVEGGFLDDWKPKRSGTRANRNALESEEDSGFKRRGRKEFFISNDAQLVLAALPTRAAVYEDKGPSTSIRSSSQKSTKPKAPRSSKARERFKTPTKPTSTSSGSDSEAFGCSSDVDSELAEDYAGNLGAEVSLEELTEEMALRSLGLMPGDDETDDEFDLSGSETEDDDQDSGSDGESEFHPGLGYESGDKSDDDDEDEVDAVVSRQESRLESLDLSDAEELIGVLEPSFVLDRGRKEKKQLDLARRKGVPGEKKKRKKELIARKRKERALRRGVDLDSVNLMFESMVISNCDMLALQPMKHRDLTLVNKLAAVYRLKVGAHGSGKKRFPTVSRTRHTAMPQGVDIQHLMKLLDAPDSPPRTTKRSEAGSATRSAKYKRADRQERRMSMEAERDPSQLGLGRRNKAAKTRRKDADRPSPIHQQPLAFVSSGVIQPGDAAVVLVSETSVSMRGKEKRDEAAAAAAAAPLPIGSFEAHTKGFGSRMLAKMGFVEGSGLGKDGQGMTQPLVPRRRPKSLGLGA